MHLMVVCLYRGSKFALCILSILITNLILMIVEADMIRRLALSLAGMVAFSAALAEPVKIGFITTLSTPAGYLGADMRDAFMLAIKNGGGQLGGVDVELVVEDDGLKPSNAKQSVERMIKSGIQLYTGVNFSNVLAAVVPSVTKADYTYVSSNPGPSSFAGKRCHPNYFVASYQNDLIHAASGSAANELGYKKVVILAPNYQAGRDAVSGFKANYEGEVLGELYTKLDQSDFSVELARIRSLKPDAIYQFHPGGTGINFAKQYGNSGLAETIPMLMSPFSMDAQMVEATGSVAEGFYITGIWARTLDNPQTKKFVEDFQNEYGRVPTEYAMQAYDTANLIASALAKVDGDLSRKDEFHAALKAADFESLRGEFKFANNQHPTQDFYLVQLQKNDAGKLEPVVMRKVLEQATDIYAQECEM